MIGKAMTSKFEREKHVYTNDKFGEMLKDAVRFFHGSPVHSLPPPEEFSGAGVYAIYCIARNGIYAKFGNIINREEYAVPMYVGKAVASGWRQNQKRQCQMFSRKTIFEQLSCWSRLIGISFGLKEQFAFRACQFGDATMVNAVHRKLVRKFHPAWNLFFASCATQETIEGRWRLAHSIRFQSKANASVKRDLALLLMAV